MDRYLPLVFATALLLAQAAAWGRSPAPADANLYIISPAHGELVDSPLRVRFGLRGMGVAPAGVDKAGTGHHHLLIDVDQLPSMEQPLPKDRQHRHFGAGQTEVLLDLPAGRHTLQLILGDKNHMPHDPPLVSERIVIHVK